MTTHTPATQRKRVVIVGAGFGGVAAAEWLAHLPVAVAMVDQHDYHTFKPLVYQSASLRLHRAPGDRRRSRHQSHRKSRSHPSCPADPLLSDNNPARR